jgi:hypothetical protein
MIMIARNVPKMPSVANAEAGKPLKCHEENLMRILKEKTFHPIGIETSVFPERRRINPIEEGMGIKIAMLIRRLNVNLSNPERERRKTSRGKANFARNGILNLLASSTKNPHRTPDLRKKKEEGRAKRKRFVPIENLPEYHLAKITKSDRTATLLSLS